MQGDFDVVPPLPAPVIPVLGTILYANAEVPPPPQTPAPAPAHTDARLAAAVAFELGASAGRFKHIRRRIYSGARARPVAAWLDCMQVQQTRLPHATDALDELQREGFNFTWCRLRRRRRCSAWARALLGSCDGRLVNEHNAGTAAGWNKVSPIAAVAECGELDRRPWRCRATRSGISTETGERKRKH